jgi:hypothetical protein
MVVSFMSSPLIVVGTALVASAKTVPPHAVPLAGLRAVVGAETDVATGWAAPATDDAPGRTKRAYLPVATGETGMASNLLKG